jgi:hypothetical protein
MEATKPYSNLFVEPKKPKEPLKIWEKIVLAGIIIYIAVSIIKSVWN